MNPDYSLPSYVLKISCNINFRLFLDLRTDFFLLVYYNNFCACIFSPMRATWTLSFIHLGITIIITSMNHYL